MPNPISLAGKAARLDDAVQALRKADKEFHETTGHIDQLLTEIRYVVEAAQKAFWNKGTAVAEEFRTLKINLEYRMGMIRATQTKAKADKDAATERYLKVLDSLS